MTKPEYFIEGCKYIRFKDYEKIIFRCISDFAPTQYDVLRVNDFNCYPEKYDKPIAYVRLRNGWLYCDLFKDSDGENIIYEHHFSDKGKNNFVMDQKDDVVDSLKCLFMNEETSFLKEISRRIYEEEKL